MRSVLLLFTFAITILGFIKSQACTWDSDCLNGYECEDGECHSTGPTLDQRTQFKFVGQLLAKAGFQIHCGTKR